MRFWTPYASYEKYWRDAGYALSEAVEHTVVWPPNFRTQRLDYRRAGESPKHRTPGPPCRLPLGQAHRDRGWHVHLWGIQLLGTTLMV